MLVYLILIMFLFRLIFLNIYFKYCDVLLPSYFKIQITLPNALLEQFGKLKRNNKCENSIFPKAHIKYEFINDISHFPDIRSGQQGKGYFSVFRIKSMLLIRSLQSYSPRSYLYFGTSIVFVVYHHNHSHQLHTDDNAVIADR